MNTGTAWSLRGVDAETREAILEAARLSGMSVGEWLRSVVDSENAEPEFPADEMRPTSMEPEDPISRIDRRLDAMELASRKAFNALTEQLRSATAANDQPRTVPEMVKALARELDNTDEDARTIIEGKRPVGVYATDTRRNRDDQFASSRDIPEARLEEVSRRVGNLLARREHASVSPTLEHALAELESRIDAARQRLSTAAAPTARRNGPSSAARAATPPKALAEIEAQLAALSQRLQPEPSAGVAEPASEPVRPDPLATALQEITQRQRALDNADAEGQRDTSGLADSIAAVHQDLAALADQIQAIGRVNTEEKGAYFELARRMDVLAAEAPLERNELEALRRDLRAMIDASAHDTRLDRARLDALGEEVAALRRDLNASADPHALDRIEHKVAELAGMVEANATQQILPEVGRLEAQVSSLTGMIENVLASLSVEGRDAPLQRLEGHVAELTERLERLIADGSAPVAFDELRADVEAMRAEIGGQPSTDLSALEKDIRGLAARVDDVAARDSGSEAIGELEARIEQIASGLATAEIGGDTLRRLEQNLSDVRAHLADSQQESAHAARAAAEEAVRGLAERGTREENALIRDLRSDLEDLKAAANERDDATPSESTALDTTIANVSSRIDRLAEQAAEEDLANAPVVPRATPDSAADDAADMPSQSTDARARRADFIAAARRAAQAAAETQADARHMEPAEDEEPAERADGPFRRISRAIQGRKKSLILTAAAIVIAIGAVQLYSNLEATVDAPLITGADRTGIENPFLSSRTETPVAVAPQAAPVTPTRSLALAPPSSVAQRFENRPPATSASSFEPRQPVGAASAPASTGPSDLETAANAGDPAAAYQMATRYSEGTDANPQLAFTWYQRAAEGGLAVAQYRIGSLYERGTGTAQDLRQAVNWYQRAADQGNVNAMHNLAVLLSEGVDGQPDHAKALKWFTAAANYGVKDSQYNLGVLYARGIGTSQDLPASYTWFAIAAASGDRDSAARRDEVANMLPPESLAQARSAVQSWSKRPEISEANHAPTRWAEASMVDAADQQQLVQTIQTLLASEGYNPGPADGMVGPRTRQAVLDFQRSKGVPATGQIDRTLVAMLSSGAR